MQNWLSFTTVNGVEVAVDGRGRLDRISPSGTVVEPLLLEWMELGLSGHRLAIAQSLLQAQNAYYEASGQLRMVSEDNISEQPFFLYAGVADSFGSFPVVASDGTRHLDKRTLSTKAAFAWHALSPNDYTKLVRDHVIARVSGAVDSQSYACSADVSPGLYAGTFENDGRLNDVLSLNTNAAVLAALQYQMYGPLH